MVGEERAQWHQAGLFKLGVIVFESRVRAREAWRGRQRSWEQRGAYGAPTATAYWRKKLGAERERQAELPRGGEGGGGEGRGAVGWEEPLHIEKEQ